MWLATTSAALIRVLFFESHNRKDTFWIFGKRGGKNRVHFVLNVPNLNSCSNASLISYRPSVAVECS